jgi:hypothetical protein
MTEIIIFSLLLGAVAGYCLKTVLVTPIQGNGPFAERCEALTNAGHGDRCDLTSGHKGPHCCVCTNGIRLQDIFWWAQDPRSSQSKPGRHDHWGSN